MSGYGYTAGKKTWPAKDGSESTVKPPKEIGGSGTKGVATRVVKASDMSKFGVMNADFYVSGAYGEIKDLSSAEIIALASKTLIEVNDFVIESVLKTLNTSKELFSTEIIEPKRALSRTSYDRLIEALETRTLPRDNEQILVIATAIYGVLGMFASTQDIKGEATDLKEQLLAKLSEVDNFLEGKRDEPKEISSTLNIPEEKIETGKEEHFAGLKR